MFNFVYIKRDYIDYFDALLSDDKRILRFKSSERLSSFLMKVASYISSGQIDLASVWNIECNHEPIAVIEMHGDKECRFKLLIDDTYVSDLSENFLYCHLVSTFEVTDIHKIA